MLAERKFSLKDQLFNADKVAYLASCFIRADASFAKEAFCQQVLAGFAERELKARIHYIADCLADFLPDDFVAATDIILNALPPELDPQLTDDDFGDFIFAPLGEYVVNHGLNEVHLNRSLNVLKAITKRFSVEYAIRPFLNEYPNETIAFLMDCTQDSHYHVRRLACEGTRPALPWGIGISIDYLAVIPLLDHLHGDTTRFVTRSVANHLNDISKFDADTVIKCLQKWRSKKKQSAKELDYMTKHALRTLVKKGHPAALALLGYSTDPAIEVVKFAVVNKEVAVGSSCEFVCEIRSGENAPADPQPLMIDYVIAFANSKKLDQTKKQPSKQTNNQAPNTSHHQKNSKVFKLKTMQLKPNEALVLKKKHPFKVMTTRRLALGEHIITLQINGKALAKTSFVLVD